MKKIIAILSIMGFSSVQLLHAQHKAKAHLQVAAGSGVKSIRYETDNYQDGTQVPYFGRVGLKYGVLELGGEYNGDITPATFLYTGTAGANERFREKHKQTYYGGYVGVNTLVKEYVGVILRLGAGLNCMTRQVTMADGHDYMNKALDSVVEYRVQIGLSIKLSKHIALNVEGQYARMNRNEKDFAADLHYGDSYKFTIHSLAAFGVLVFQL